ncbi:MAG: ABC transporter permease [Thermodesulfobacteriota bacterium]
MKREPFFWISVSCGFVIMAFILLPLIQLLTSPSAEMLRESISDKNVVRSIWLSIYTAGLAALISFFFGTPLAYLLARHDFRGKRLVEGIIDLPIAIPHPVVGIAILSVAGKNHWFGQLLAELGIRIMGSVTGIVTVLVFVGIPFYLNAAKAGFEAISPRLEKVSRSLGASMFSTFARITFPLAWRSMLIGIIMCSARAISEFGAVVIVAYHPMVAPVLIYERFEAYGLKYSQPVAVWLVSISLILFLLLRILTLRKVEEQ